MFERHIEDDFLTGRDEDFGDRSSVITGAAICDLVTAEGNIGEGIAAGGIRDRADIGANQLDGDAGKGFLGGFVDDDAADRLG